MRGMKAGKLRHRVRLETPGIVMDSDGLRENTWVAAFEVAPVMPADVKPLSGKEFLAAQAQQSKVTHQIRMRWRAGVKPQMRARQMRADGTGEIFNVEAVIEDNESGTRWLTLLASSGVSDGE